MNDKINGIGKEYDKDGDLIFEGEFLFGEEYKGIKRKYYKNKNPIFDLILSENRLKFEGQYLKGKKME